jgi:hypothetical protein
MIARHAFERVVGTMILGSVAQVFHSRANPQVVTSIVQTVAINVIDFPIGTWSHDHPVHVRMLTTCDRI